MTRYEIARKAYENDEMEGSTFGQLDMHSFSTKCIVDAIERGWITAELAARLLDAPFEEDEGSKQIEAQITTINGEINCYKRVIQDSIQSIQDVAARLTLDRCSEVDSLQAYAKRITDARARIEELERSITALKFMLTKSN